MAQAPERIDCNRSAGGDGGRPAFRRGADARLPRAHRRARFGGARVRVARSRARARARRARATARAGRCAGRARRPAVRREGHHRHARHADLVRLADSRRASSVRRCGVRGAGARGRRASCSARRSPPSSRCAIPDRRRIRAISRTRPEDRRADRPPRSPTSWCPWRSARRPAARSSVPHRIAAWSATSPRSTRSIRRA